MIVRTEGSPKKVRLARGASDEREPDGYLALTARSATMYGGTSQAPFFYALTRCAPLANRAPSRGLRPFGRLARLICLAVSVPSKGWFDFCIRQWDGRRQRSFNRQSTAFVMRGLRVRLPSLALVGLSLSGSITDTKFGTGPPRGIQEQFRCRKRLNSISSRQSC